MQKKSTFQQIIADFISRPLEGVLERDLNIPADVPKIVSLLGPRRSGKTYAMFDIISRLRKKVPADRLVYINFEDDRLFPLQLEDLDAMLRGFYEMYPGNKDERVWFFLDEVQEVANWEKFVRRLWDQENCRIYLTGSSSKLLSRDLATALRGRTLPFEIFPLSYREFLRFNDIVADPRSSKGKALLLHWLHRYLRQGGFPELVFLPVELHRRTIHEYTDLMLYRDLVDRFSIKNPALLKYLLKFMLSNMANPISISKTYRDLKSQGFAVARNTVFEYFSYLEEAFILFRVDIRSRSVRAKEVNPSKVYAVDPAFKRVMVMGEDIGRVFENAVFLALRRHGISPSYIRNGFEVDFYWEGGQLINACYSLDSPQTVEREIGGLTTAMEMTDADRAWLLTMDEKRDVKMEGRMIHILPLWEFLLEPGLILHA